MDPEQHPVTDKHLLNTTVKNITWSGVTATIQAYRSSEPKAIVDNVKGIVKAGEICAVIGPAGCGKTTLVNLLAGRPTNATSIEGNILVNGCRLSKAAFCEISCFIEQDHALLRSLTVRETMAFKSRIGRTRPLPKKDNLLYIENLLESFGLVDQANTLIGMLSDSQKRRISIASQLITSPKLVFLNNPTSGLSSAASWEVIKYLQQVARKNNLIVFCSIRQPLLAFDLFNKLLLLTSGKAQYFGPPQSVLAYYQESGLIIPQGVSPAEFILELIDIDAAQDREAATQRLDHLQAIWKTSDRAKDISTAILRAEREGGHLSIGGDKRLSMASLTLTLLHRSFFKSYGDVLACNIRLAIRRRRGCHETSLGTISTRGDHGVMAVKNSEELKHT